MPPLAAGACAMAAFRMLSLLSTIGIFAGLPGAAAAEEAAAAGSSCDFAQLITNASTACCAAAAGSSIGKARAVLSFSGGRVNLVRMCLCYINGHLSLLHQRTLRTTY